MKKRGTGVGSMWYGIGNTGLPNPAAAFVEVHFDGSVTLLTGCADIGQGSTTVLAQIVAESLGLEYEKVKVTAADTGVTPEAGATSASRQTYISGNACKSAAEMAKSSLIKAASKILPAHEEEIDLKDGYAYVKSNPREAVDIAEVLAQCSKEGILAVGSGSFNPPTVSLSEETMEGAPYATYAFATQVVEIEVDTSTGEVEILKIIAVHDVGRAINPKQVEGQIEGGCIMGSSYALLEELDVAGGVIQNDNLSRYLIFTMKDVPEIYPFIIEDPEPTGPFGAKGVGEPALIPTAPAILNAFYDATGVRLFELPITQEKVLERLKEEGKL